MKYLYTIVVIVVLFSGLAAYGIFDTGVEISEPVLSVNDRIFSRAELDRLLADEPPDMTREEFVQALIEKQLLIQEAVRQQINSEESFRRSVQNFYEQSLVKILLDRKLATFVVDVTTEEVARYESLTAKTVSLTKMVYPSLADLRNRTSEQTRKIEADFLNLSDDLKFILLGLEPGDSSDPVRSQGNMVIYRLDSLTDRPVVAGMPEKAFDVKRVSLFIRDKKRTQLLGQWMDSIRETADIWREDS